MERGHECKLRLSFFAISNSFKIYDKNKSGSIIQIGSIQGILGNDGRIYKGSRLFGRTISSPKGLHSI